MAMAPLYNRFALDSFNTNTAATVNLGFAALFALIHVFLTGLKTAPQSMLNPRLIAIAVCNGVGTILLYFALASLGPVPVAFLGRFYIVFALLLSVVVLKEHFDSKEGLCIALAVGGLFLFSLPSDGHRISWVGVTAALSYTFLFAATNLMISRLGGGLPPAGVLAVNQTLSFVLVLIFGLARNSLDFRHPSREGWLFCIASAFAGGYAGLLLYYHALPKVRFSTGNIIRSTSPILAAAFAWPFFPVALNAANITGLLLLFSSLVVLSLVRQKQNEHRRQN